MIFQSLEEKRLSNRVQSLALIDPDKKNDSILTEMIKNINISKFDAILVGGSYISDNNFDKRIQIIKYLQEKSNAQYNSGDYKGCIRSLRRMEKYY